MRGKKRKRERERPLQRGNERVGGWVLFLVNRVKEEDERETRK